MRKITYFSVILVFIFNVWLAVAAAESVKEVHLLAIESGANVPVQKAVVRCGAGVAITDNNGVARISIVQKQMNYYYRFTPESSVVLCNANHPRFLIGRSHLLKLSEQETKYELIIELEPMIPTQTILDTSAGAQ